MTHLLIQLKALAYGVETHLFRGSSLIAQIPLELLSHAQGCISWVIFDNITWAIKNEPSQYETAQTLMLMPQRLPLQMAAHLVFQNPHASVQLSYKLEDAQNTLPSLQV